MAAKLFILKLEKNACQVVLEVNGIAMETRLDAKPVDSFQPINLWVWAGVNQARARIEWPRDVPYTPARAFCNTAIYLAEDGEKLAGKPALSARSWPGPGDTEGYPAEYRLNFMVENPPPSMFWPQAKPFDLTEDSRREIVQKTMSIHEHFAQRNVDQLLADFDFKAAEFGTTMGLEPEVARAQQRQFFETITDTPDWAVTPLNPEEIQIHLLASNKIVMITKPGKAPVLKSVPETGIRASIPLFLAPVGGKWTVVR